MSEDFAGLLLSLYKAEPWAGFADTGIVSDRFENQGGIQAAVVEAVPVPDPVPIPLSFPFFDESRQNRQ